MSDIPQRGKWMHFFGVKSEDKTVFMHTTKACMGSGDVAPLILNLDTVWKWVFSLTPRLLYSPKEKSLLPSEFLYYSFDIGMYLI